MAKVQILNMVVLDNPCHFRNPFQFEITFECIEDLPDDLEWKIIYVGSAESEDYDQVLDSVLVGPVPAGRHMFVFQVSLSSREKGALQRYRSSTDASDVTSQESAAYRAGLRVAYSWNLAAGALVDEADAPNSSLIPESDAVGVTVVLITCTYRGQEFIRVGYYVNNEYSDPELRENPPLKPDFCQLQRNILASNPRVTRFHINWESASESKMEDIENVDPASHAMLPPSCAPTKGLTGALNTIPENSMDCI